MAEIETTETVTVLTRGSDGKAYDLTLVPQPFGSESANAKAEWLLLTGATATTEDGITFYVASQDLTLTKVGG